MHRSHIQPAASSDVSAWVRRHAEKIVNAGQSRPVLDLACGTGRNGRFLAQLGCEVIGIDIDISKTVTKEHFQARRMDLDAEPWPFRKGELGGIIQVHFLRRSLFAWFAHSLVPGGFLLIETVPGCGGNYLELPRAGELSAQLAADFHLEAYREGKVGPPGTNAVTVRALARRKQ